MNQAPSLSSCIFYSFIRRLCRFCFISPLHMPHSPPGVFSIPNCAFGLSPIPSSPVCAPCSAQICCLCSLRCAHMLALPLPSPPPPAPGPSSVPLLRASLFARGPIREGRILLWLLLPFHAAGSSPLLKGNPCCSHSTADWWRRQSRLCSCLATGSCCYAATDGTALANPAHSGPSLKPVA